MLQLNLGDAIQFMPAAVVTSPTSRPRVPTAPTNFAPATYTQPTRGTPTQPCAYGYTHGPGGVCMSQGCFDGRSQCVAMDTYGRTCSYDQFLAVGNACGPAPSLPAPPIVPSAVPGGAPPNVTPGIPVDVSPSPGTQATAIVPPDQIPGMRYQVPRWAWAVGAVSVIAILAALLARR